MKGQMFIIIAVVVISVLVLLKTSLNLVNILENKRYLEAGLERLEFKNAKDELVRSIKISYNQSSNITNNVNDFSKFARNSLSARAMKFTGLLISSIFPNVSGSTQMNVTTLNLFEDDLQNLNFTFSYDSSTSNFTSVAPLQSVTTSFTFPATDANYTLTVYYKTASENATQNITIPVEVGKSKYIGFFDLRLSSNRLEQKDKVTETVVLNETRQI